jgi:transcriptional regulator with XRE-family HTH domain
VAELRKTVAETFGEKLAAARTKAGLSQEELADLCAIHRSGISKLEEGKRSPRLDTVVKIAGALEVDICQLVSGVRWEPGKTSPGRIRRD